MTKRRKRPIQPIPLTIGNDPTLWRFDSLHDALAANAKLLAQLIQAGETLVKGDVLVGDYGDAKPFDETSSFTGD